MTRPLIAAGLFAFLGVSPAFGADDDLNQVVVSYGGLDLHSTSGRTELKARIVNAASTLCYPRWIARNPDSEFSVRYREMIYRACLGRVTNRAMAKIDATRQAGTAVQN